MIKIPEFDVQNLHTGFYTVVSIVADRDNNIIHILDLDQEETRSLTNAVDGEFLSWILDEINDQVYDGNFIDGTNENIMYWLYGTDGLVCQYNYNENGLASFTHIPYNELMPENFIEIMRSRKGNL